MNELKKSVIHRAIPLAAGAALIAAFYPLSRVQSAMDAAKRVSHYVRLAIAAITELLPFSVFEVGGTLAAAFALFHIVVSVVRVARANGKRLLIAARQVLPLLSGAAVALALFLWLWTSVSFAAPFYDGVLANVQPTEQELAAALRRFIQGANEYAAMIPRDADGHAVIDTRAVLRSAADALPFNVVAERFPLLEGYGATRPKPMLYSEVMS
ncbi:MAG: DUF3810 family protein, partial [Oscillospiraceae bacterium]|nr:DUF3810 family protein [Oscillospiraceae bacterium]